MSMTHLLFWSGGFDSTAILLDMLTDSARYPKIRVVSYGVKAIHNCEEDKNARKAISKLLDLEKNARFEMIDFDIDYFPFISGSQAKLWACLASMFVSAVDNPLEIVFGYIKHDDFWHERPEFEAGIKNLIQFGQHCEFNVKFNYPLEWMTKKEMLSKYLGHSDVFDRLSWGGDTDTCKLKDKVDLEFIFRQMMSVKYDCDIMKDSNKKEICTTETEEKPKTEIQSSNLLMKEAKSLVLESCIALSQEAISATEVSLQSSQL